MVQKAIKNSRTPFFGVLLVLTSWASFIQSQLLRSFAASLVGIFVPIYLYKIGYSLPAITAIKPRLVLAVRCGRMCRHGLLGRGPKHAIALSVILQNHLFVARLTQEHTRNPLWIIGVVGSFSFGLYMMAFKWFSKIKHTGTRWKRTRVLQICERIKGVLGPLVGGVIATVFDPRYTIALAIVVLIASLVPILWPKSQRGLTSKLSLRAFHGDVTVVIFVSTAFILENVISITIWPLFLGVFVLVSNTYAVLGLLTAVSTGVVLVAIMAIGKLIDKNQGKRLLNIGAYTNAVIHLFRPFVTSPLGSAFGIGLVNEPVTAMYRMPFIKGRYDASDSVPGVSNCLLHTTWMGQCSRKRYFWGALTIALLVGPDKLAYKQLSYLARS